MSSELTVFKNWLSHLCSPCCLKLNILDTRDTLSEWTDMGWNTKCVHLSNVQTHRPGLSHEIKRQEVEWKDGAVAFVAATSRPAQPATEIFGSFFLSLLKFEKTRSSCLCWKGFISMDFFYFLFLLLHGLITVSEKSQKKRCCVKFEIKQLLFHLRWWWWQ